MKCKLVGAIVFLLALFLSFSSAYAGSGTVTVTLLPAEVQATARWNASIPGAGSACPGAPCQFSGATHSFNWNGGGNKNVTITLSDVPGYITPAPVGTIQLINGGSINTTYTYLPEPAATGSVSVTITPAGANTAGAQWTVDDGANWNDSGATVSGLAVGNHTVKYNDVTNWTKPADEVVAVVADATTSTTGTYVQHVGSLSVTIEPEGARTASAQWRVDGGAWQNSGATVNNIPVGTYLLEFSTIANWDTPADQNVDINNGATTNATGTYVQHVGSLAVTIEPEGARTASAQWRVDGGAWQNSGATVNNIPVGTYLLEFSTIANWDTPASQNVDINNGATTNATGTYVQHVGSLAVTIEPEGARTASAQWSADGGITWNNSGVTVNNLPVGAYTVQFSTIANWDTPASQNVNINNGATTNATGTYILSVGSLQVFIEPLGARDAGALWRVDGGAWNNSGDTVNDLAVGSHVVSFFDIANWDTPVDQNVDILSGATTSTTGTYVQHVGSLQVFIEPEGARNAAAQWRVNGGGWLNPGAVVANLPVGDYAIDFKTIYGWDTPAADTVTVLKDQTGDTTGTYVQQTGWLRVTLEPEAAVLDGALWGFVDDPIPARSSGDAVLKFVDTYGIHFNDIAGWDTPGVQVVDVLNNVTVDATARYLPKPVLISPADGAADVAVKPTLQAAEVGPGLLPPGFVHNNSRWQISKTAAFAKSDLVLDFTDTQLTDLFVDWLALAANTTYWWRVKHLDTAAGFESGWADAFSFTTQAAAPIKGDVNGDRIVNDADLKLIRALVGVRIGNPKYVAAADLDGNGRIDSIDINQWYKAYTDFLAGRY